MRTVAVFTGARSEYGLLYWLIKGLQQSSECKLQLIVSGAHLSSEFGNTWQEIEKDGFTIDAKIEMLLSAATATAVVKSMGLALIGIADALERLKPDLLVILGDRTEALAVAQAALVMKIPIAHIHGGELTQGAYDDAIRHAITKMAIVHFTAAEPYKKRVIQLGETPNSVFNVGSLGLENCYKTLIITQAELAKILDIPLNKPYILVTYHAVTQALEINGCQALLEALDDYLDLQVLFTYPNADNGADVIVQRLKEYCYRHQKRAFLVKSLGYKRYLAAIAHAEIVAGNSSSGIIEVPAFKIPTVNIGSRQIGRLFAESIIQSKPDCQSIRAAFRQAFDLNFRKFCKTVTNPYGQGDTSQRIITVLKDYPLNTVKVFKDWKLYDI